MLARVHVWTFDHIIEVVTMVAAIVGAAAAIRYGRRGISTTETLSAQETERSSKAGRPRISATLVRAPDALGKGSAQITVRNSGGAALPACILLTDVLGRFWCGVSDFAAHQAALTTTFSANLKGITGAPGLVFAVARDAQGVWWDQRFDQVIDGPDAGDHDALMRWWVDVVFPGVLTQRGDAP